MRFQKLPNESENRDKSKGVSMSTRLKNAWNRILEEDGEDDKKKKKGGRKRREFPRNPRRREVETAETARAERTRRRQETWEA